MKTEIGEGKYLDVAKIKSTNNGHLHGQPSFPPSFGKGPNIIEDKKGLRGPGSSSSLSKVRTTAEGS